MGVEKSEHRLISLNLAEIMVIRLVFRAKHRLVRGLAGAAHQDGDRAGVNHAPDAGGIRSLHQPGRAFHVHGRQRALVIASLVAVAKERRRVKEHVGAAERRGKTAGIRQIARNDFDVFHVAKLGRRLFTATADGFHPDSAPG